VVVRDFLIIRNSDDDVRGEVGAPLLVPASGHVQVSAKVSCSAADNSACQGASTSRSGNHSAARCTGNAAFCIVSETSGETKKDCYEKNGSEIHLTILWSDFVGRLFEGSN
jgi:hypothetical protein